jgi:hypothetical protein
MVAFTAGAVLTAANLNTAFNALTLRTVTSTSDTLVLADNGGGVTYSNASATTSTIPPNSSVAFAVGTKIVLINLGAGVVTVTAGAGVTVNGATLTLAQDAGGTCIKTATNTWSFLPFSSGVGAADFSDTATGTYTGFKYITFSSGSGTLTVTTAGFADIVVLGGGGAGIGVAGGGGGAGGLLQVTNAYLPVGTLTVTVGAGGAKISGATAFAPSGSPSRLGDYYGVGGGGCFDRRNLATHYGGSGGGGSYGAPLYTGGTGTPGQGNNGGTGATSSAGGGGGAGGVGANGTAGTTGGAGGTGMHITLAGTTPTGAYVAGNYGLGGGGGGAGSAAGGAATFGGGAGASAADATDGAANRGGGGGGTFTTVAQIGGSGGSGIVIVRVAV